MRYAASGVAMLLGMGATLTWAQSAPVPTAGIASAVVESSLTAAETGFDGVVDAVHQTTIAAQVAGTVVEVRVKAGEPVKAGQVLVRIDARTAEQGVAAGDAQVQAARASLEVATQEYERQKALLQRNYISQAAFERAEAQFKATQAQVNAQLAQAGAARAQSGFFVVSAPYSGMIAEVPITVGDMAMPGRALVNLYDPTALRVTAMVPESVASRAAAGGKGIAIEIPGLAEAPARLAPSRVQVLPTADPSTHTVEVRLDLPRTVQHAIPGMFARAWLHVDSLARPGSGSPRLYVPAQAVVRRAEMTGLYVLDPQGRPQLRQVRLGQAIGERIEVLSGIAAGERVALDPQVAARAR